MSDPTEHLAKAREVVKAKLGGCGPQDGCAQTPPTECGFCKMKERLAHAIAQAITEAVAGAVPEYEKKAQDLARAYAYMRHQEAQLQEVTAERDRLRAALEQIRADGECDCDQWNYLCAFCVSVRIARAALEGTTDGPD